MKRLVVAGIAGVLALSPVAEAVASCLSKNERTALQLRALQTELMVAALSCRSVVQQDIIGDYNTFARRYEHRLAASGKSIVGYFDRLYGNQSRKRHDAYFTALANDYSRVSMTSPAFCDQSVRLMRDVLRLDQREIDGFSAARQVATWPEPATCAVAAAGPTAEGKAVKR